MSKPEISDGTNQKTRVAETGLLPAFWDVVFNRVATGIAKVVAITSPESQDEARKITDELLSDLRADRERTFGELVDTVETGNATTD